MRKITEFFMWFFIFVGIVTTIAGIHEIGHYIISRHYKAEIVDICFLGHDFNGDERWYDSAAGWVTISYNNNTDVEKETYWNNLWDLRLDG